MAAADIGLDTPSERQTPRAGITEKPLSYSPLWNDFTRAMPTATGPTALQRDLIKDREWHASEMYDRHIRPTRVGEGLLSAVRLEHTGTWDHWYDRRKGRGVRPDRAHGAHEYEAKEHDLPLVRQRRA